MKSFKEFQEQINESLLDEEQLDELSKATLASYIKKASRNIGTRRALATTFDKNADSARNPATKEMNRKIAGDFTMDARKRVQGVDKAVSRLAKEEAEQIDELSKDTLRSYTDKTEKDMVHRAGVRRALTAMSKDHQYTPEGQKSFAADADKESHKLKTRNQGTLKAIKRLAKEELELDEAQELTHSKVAKLMADTKTRGEAIEKVKKLYGCSHDVAAKHVDSVIDKSMKEEAEQLDELSPALIKRYKAANKDDRENNAMDKESGDREQIKYARERDKKRYVGSKLARHRDAPDAYSDENKMKRKISRIYSEDLELDEEIKPYVSGDHKDGWSILDHSGKEVKKFHWKDYMDHPIKDKRKAARDDAMAYFKKHFNSLRKPAKSVNEGLDELSHKYNDRFDQSVDILLSLEEEEYSHLVQHYSLVGLVEALCEMSEEEIQEILGE